MNYQGTWEHKARIAEMAKTAAEAAKQTAALEVEGKHHIGDFLPPEELSKFMNKMKVYLGETLQLFDIGKRLFRTRFYSSIIFFCLFIVSRLIFYVYPICYWRTPQRNKNLAFYFRFLKNPPNFDRFASLGDEKWDSLGQLWVSGE